MLDFQTVFFVYQIKNLKKINLRVRFLTLKIAFLGGFENDNIFFFQPFPNNLLLST